ncbi:MAG: prohibitin family protein [Azoarcus sp.]|jgi:regulator of protease activity HflC (stomatin/prohibitin superfamily)|nr:prohibitin family protein [Azoarcus sp.]
MEHFDSPLPNGDAPRSRKEKAAELLKAGLQRIPLRRTIILGALCLAGYGIATHLPVQMVERGEVGLRTNQWTGRVDRFRDGSVLVVPGIHAMRALSLRDQVYRPSKDDEQSFLFQSIEGLTLGVDFTVRYALDIDRLSAAARSLPDNIDGEIVMPVIQGVLHKTLSRYTVREIFSARRQEIQNEITQELQVRLGEDGVKLKDLSIGKIDLPPDYRKGMEKMLAAELASEQMKYTLELKEKQVRESELQAEAEKVRREQLAQASAQEQIIAAQAQAEAMKHILPFKEKQIRQRELEADADKAGRIRNAQGAAEARRIEAEAEADSRKKLADAEAYRLDLVGKVNSEQMAREGAILARSPLLIQKTLAEKLSDKVQVIIAPPGANGRFIGENLVGRLPVGRDGAGNVTTTNHYANNGETAGED